MGLRGGRLGRLVRLGSGRERRSHALARRDRVPPLGDDPGEEGHAPRLERRPRLAARSASPSSGRSSRGAASSTRSTASRSPRSAPGSSASSPIVAAVSITLILTRLPLLRSRTKLESLVSREAAFLYNNLFLVAFALTVLWGVLYPIVSEAVRGVAVTVGAPYYNFFGIVFGLPLVLLMGVGPLVAWRKASLRSLGASLVGPRQPPSRSGVVLLALGRRLEPARPRRLHVRRVRARGDRPRVRARHARAVAPSGTGAGRPPSRDLVSRNRRRYGGYVVHAAIVLLLFGAIGVGAFGTTHIAKLARADSMRGRRLHARYAGTSHARGPNAQELRANDRRLARRRASSAQCPRRQEPLLRRAADVERGRDPYRLAPGGRPVRDRRPVQRGRLRLSEGARQPAREPHLARRGRLRRRRR